MVADFIPDESIILPVMNICFWENLWNINPTLSLRLEIKSISVEEMGFPTREKKKCKKHSKKI